MDDLTIEIINLRHVDKGALKGFFTLVMWPSGQKIFDCRYFVMDDKRWFSFPSKEVNYSDGRQKEYIPLISFLNKPYFEKLKELTLKELEAPNLKETNGKTHNQTHSWQTHKVPPTPSSDTLDLPF
jgi:hypothetical protein